MMPISTQHISNLKPLETASARRFDYLDSLRGLAAMAVVLSHVKQAYTLPKSLAYFDLTPLGLFWDGAASVKLFFVLSGFVLSYKYFKNSNGMAGFSYPVYIIARIFRIMPLFLFVLFFSAIIRNYFFIGIPSSIPMPTEAFYEFWNNKITLSQFLKQAVLVIDFGMNSYQRLIPQDWTLSGELKQSVFLPVLIFISLRNRWILLVLVSLILFFSPQNPIFYFYLGIVIAQHITVFNDTWNSLSLPYKVVLLFIGICLYSNYTSYLNIKDDKLVGIGSFMIISITLCSSKIQNVLNSKTLLFIGKMSFGVYLFHFVVLINCVPLFIKYLNYYGVANHEVVFVLTCAILMLITILVSFVGYYLIEMPGVALGKKLGKVVADSMSRVKPSTL